MIAKKPILLVEDDLVDVMTVKRALKELKIDNALTVAGNGEEALELIKDDAVRPGIVLLDLNMPKMNGLEFLQAVREQSLLHGVPIIITYHIKRRERQSRKF